MDEQNKKGKRKAQWQNDYIARTYDRINLTVPKGYKALLQEAATEQHGGKVNSLLNALITAELERQKLIPSEAAQRPTEAVTASQNETTPPQTGTPSEAHRGRPGVVMGDGNGSGSGTEQVTSSPTHDLNSTEAEKLPSEYTYADFEAMDDEEFRRFVKMSGQELGRYLQNVGWPDSTKVIGRWERAQRLEKQRRQRELDYN